MAKQRCDAAIVGIHEYPLRQPAFVRRLPYALAWIDLDEGFRLMTNMTGVVDPTRDIRVGQRVQVEWEDYDSVLLPLFRPV
ncbi:MAG: Zn-ribbon domain-containing OB-fold protein [Dehalococcoidia bacterium]